MITLIDWTIMLSDMLLSGNQTRIETARNLIDNHVRERMNREYVRQTMQSD